MNEATRVSIVEVWSVLFDNFHPDAVTTVKMLRPSILCQLAERLIKVGAVQSPCRPVLKEVDSTCEILNLKETNQSISNLDH